MKLHLELESKEEMAALGVDSMYLYGDATAVFVRHEIVTPRLEYEYSRVNSVLMSPRAKAYIEIPVDSLSLHPMHIKIPMVLKSYADSIRELAQ